MFYRKQGFLLYEEIDPDLRHESLENRTEPGYHHLFWHCTNPEFDFIERVKTRILISDLKIAVDTDTLDAIAASTQELRVLAQDAGDMEKLLINAVTCPIPTAEDLHHLCQEPRFDFTERSRPSWCVTDTFLHGSELEPP